jgi:flavorubredoxin
MDGGGRGVHTRASRFAAAANQRQGRHVFTPYEVAPETFVIPDSVPVPGVGILPVNAMVIRGEQPMLLDTLATIHRDEFLETAFSLVDPRDVRWLFLSHEDRDHSGSVMQVLDQCPNAKLITNFLGLGKLLEEFTIPSERVYLLNDGDSLDIGDRTVTAIRPPLFDSSATRGLWDPKTRVNFGADCFGAVLDENVQFVDELSPTDFEEGFFWMNRVNHVWFHHIAQEVIDEAANRIRVLDPTLIVSGHGPTDRRDPLRHSDWITRIGDMEPVPMPSQAEFEAMIAGRPEEA